MACDIHCTQIDSYRNKSHANYTIFRHFSQFSHCCKHRNVLFLVVFVQEQFDLNYCYQLKLKEFSNCFNRFPIVHTQPWTQTVWIAAITAIDIAIIIMVSNTIHVKRRRCWFRGSCDILLLLPPEDSSSHTHTQKSFPLKSSYCGQCKAKSQKKSRNEYSVCPTLWYFNETKLPTPDVMHHIMHVACYYIVLIDLFIRPIVCAWNSGLYTCYTCLLWKVYKESKATQIMLWMHGQMATLYTNFH